MKGSRRGGTHAAHVSRPLHRGVALRCLQHKSECKVQVLGMNTFIGVSRGILEHICIAIFNSAAAVGMEAGGFDAGGKLVDTTVQGTARLKGMTDKEGKMSLFIILLFSFYLHFCKNGSSRYPGSFYFIPFHFCSWSTSSTN